MTGSHAWPGRVLIAASVAVWAAGGCGGRPAPPLRINLHSAPLGFDPHREVEFVTFSVLSHVYEGLTRLDPRLRVEPALAERWDSPDELTWRFHLRSGVRFHDGRPLTAEDAAFSIERGRTLGGSAVASYLASVRAARALDPSTVEITTDRPVAVLPTKLSFVMIVPRGSPERIERPVGTGPYRLVSAGADGGVVLTAADGYQGPTPAHVAEVRLVVVPPPALLGATDALDVVQDLSPAEAAEIGRRPGFRTVVGPGVTVDSLALSVTSGPFADRSVREAVSLALDRDALVASLLGGHGQPANQLVGANVFGHDPQLPPMKRDPAAARARLRQAGYPAGLEVELEYREGREVGAIVAQLAQAGIRARPRPQPWAAVLARLRAGRVAMYYGGLMAGSGDASDVLDSTLHTRAAGVGWGDANHTGYSAPALDALIESAARTLETRARRAALQSAARIAMADLPLVPLFLADDVYAVRDGLEWRPRLDSRVLAFEVTRRAPPR